MTLTRFSRRKVLLGMSALPYAIAAVGQTPRTPGAGLDVAPLRVRFKGDLIVPEDPRYQSARLTNNRAFDRHPALIARCSDAEDVARSLEFARTNALPLAIRSGGHCQAGRSSCDAGVVIDLSKMDNIAVEPSSRHVSCGAGVRVFQANESTVGHGLALPLGICGDVGVAGLTLGGGYGYLLGVAGLACDSLIGAQVVLADGHIQTVTEESDPDLLWALRGAGANFGVVTQLHFRAHPVSEIYGALSNFPRPPATTWRRWQMIAPQLCRPNWRCSPAS